MSFKEPTFATYEGHKVAYYSCGTGSDAVVFIHGFTCDSALWEGQRPLFNRFKRTLLVDYLGHGNSDAPDIDYHQEALSRSVKAALDHAGVESAVFISHSMGGPITTMLLRLWPRLVKGIIYVDSFLRLPEHYQNTVELAPAVERFNDDAAFKSWISAICAGSEDDVVHKVIDRMTSTPKHVRTSCVTTLSRPPAFRYDEKYDIPALQIGTVFREMDPFWKWHLPQIELDEDEWKDCAHFPFMDQPERFNKVVVKWMEGKDLMGFDGSEERT